MKDIVRISQNNYIFFDSENMGDLYLPRIVAFDLSPEDERDIFIVKIINLVTPNWCIHPDNIGQRSGFPRWFSNNSKCII
jgi:hypothetical protein